MHICPSDSSNYDGYICNGASAGRLALLEPIIVQNEVSVFSCFRSTFSGSLFPTSIIRMRQID